MSNFAYSSYLMINDDVAPKTLTNVPLESGLADVTLEPGERRLVRAMFCNAVPPLPADLSAPREPGDSNVIPELFQAFVGASGTAAKVIPGAPPGLIRIAGLTLPDPSFIFGAVLLFNSKTPVNNNDFTIIDFPFFPDLSIVDVEGNAGPPDFGVPDYGIGGTDGAPTVNWFAVSGDAFNPAVGGPVGGNITDGAGGYKNITFRVVPVADPRFKANTSRATTFDTKRPWQRLPAMNIPRKNHGQTALDDGRVLLSGGAESNIDLADTAKCELFNPDTLRFEAAADMLTPSLNHRTVKLPDGKILAMGGFDKNMNLFAASPMSALYDPDTDTWDRVIKSAREIVTIPAGKTFAPTFPGATSGSPVMSSIAGAVGFLQAYVEYAPAPTSTPVALFGFTFEQGDPAGPNPGPGDTFTFRVDNTVPTAPVVNFSDADIGKTVTVEYYYIDGVASATKPGAMTVPRAYFSGPFLLPNGKVLVIGGNTPIPDVPPGPYIDIIEPTCELYDPATGTWATAPAPPYVAWNETTHAVQLANGDVLIAGGNNISLGDIPADGAADDTRDKAAIYDAALGTWSSIADINVQRAKHWMVALDDGRVMLGNGYNFTAGFEPVILASCEIYDPVLDTWTLVADTKDAHSGVRPVLSPSGKVLLCGGFHGDATQDSAAPVKTFEAYDVASNTFTVIPGPPPQMGTSEAIPTLLAGSKVLWCGGTANNLNSLYIGTPLNQAMLFCAP